MSQASTSTEAPSQLLNDLPPVPIRYVALSDSFDSPAEGMISLVATGKMRPPCRRCLRDADEGDIMHLTTYDPFPPESITPYRGSNPIFVHADECKRFDDGEMPERQMRRLMSIRAYDNNHFLMAAEVVGGNQLEEIAGRMLADGKASYINVHNAKPGCFAFKIERA